MPPDGNKDLIATTQHLSLASRMLFGTTRPPDLASVPVVVENAEIIATIKAYHWRDVLGGPMAYLNHSCVPTAYADGEGRIFALGDMRPGEEVSISYGRDMHAGASITDLHKNILVDHGFVCACPAHAATARAFQARAETLARATLAGWERQVGADIDIIPGRP